MKKTFLLLFLTSIALADGPIFLQNLNTNATGTDLGAGHKGLDISGTITATNPSVSPTGSTVPADATFIGAQNNSGNLVGLLVGQQTMANSLACVLPSDQTAIPVTVASLPLPSGAATSALQTTGNTSLATIATNSGTQATAANQATANTSLATIATNTGAATPAGTNIIGKVGIDQTTPGTTNGVVVNSSALPTGASTSANQTTANTSLSTIATNTGKSPISTTGSGSSAGATVSTVTTLSAPANAVGFILMCLDTSTANIRWAVGRTASTTLGQQLQPGRDTGFVPVGSNVSIIAESGTQNYDIQWVSQ